MAKLNSINGHFVESDYENALISFLEAEGWQYTLARALQGLAARKCCTWMICTISWKESILH